MDLFLCWLFYLFTGLLLFQKCLTRDLLALFPDISHLLLLLWMGSFFFKLHFVIFSVFYFFKFFLFYRNRIDILYKCLYSLTLLNFINASNLATTLFFEAFFFFRNSTWCVSGCLLFFFFFLSSIYVFYPSHCFFLNYFILFFYFLL